MLCNDRPEFNSDSPAVARFVAARQRLVDLPLKSAPCARIAALAAEKRAATALLDVIFGLFGDADLPARGAAA